MKPSFSQWPIIQPPANIDLSPWISLCRHTKHTLLQTQRLGVDVQGSALPLSTLNVPGSGWSLGRPGLGVVWIYSEPAGQVLLLCLILRYDRWPSGDRVAASVLTRLKTGRRGLHSCQIMELSFRNCLQTTVRMCSAYRGLLLGPGPQITTDLRQMTSSTSTVPVHLRGRTD
jgi:hypothetical protein